VIFPGAMWLERARSSPLARRLAMGAVWSLSGTVLSRAVSLLSSIATARYLGKSGFGEFGAVVNTMAVFLAAASLGLGMTAMKYVAELRVREPERAARIVALTVWTSVATGLVAAGALLVLAPWMAGHVLGAPGLTAALQASAVGLLLSSVNGAQSGALAGFGAFRAIALSNVSAAVVGLPFIVVGAARWGVPGAVWGTMASLAVGCTMAGWVLRRLTRALVPRGRAAPAPGEWSLFWRFSFPAFLSSGLVPLVSWITSAMLVNQPDGYAEMGVWNAANQWFTALLFLPTALAQVVLPALSERIGEGDRSRARRLLLAATVVNGALALAPAAVGIAASAAIMGLYGDAFRSGWPALATSLVAAAMVAVQTPCAQIIEASGRMWLRFAVNAAWAAAVIGLSWSMLRWGALGLALARSGGYVLTAAWLAILAALAVRMDRSIAEARG
jgi:O-antigen/teichoic acid export membrane protein